MASAHPANSTNVSGAASPVDSPMLPAAWPGAFGLYKYSRAAVMLNLATFIILWLIDFIGGLFQRFGIVGALISLVISLLFSVMLVCTQLASVRGKKIEISEAFNRGAPFIFKMFLLSVLVFLSVFVGLILLIIPGLIILPRLALSHYFLIDKKMDVMDAYKASWNATKGHAGKVWGIIGVSFLMILPVITIVGVLLTIYFLVLYSAALCLLYVHLTKSQKKAA
ncbi:MAG TPA: hypothetical protein VHB72_02550 [Candidatus Saccharimonadales bacterium]|nr:hypothetical protein [Candidatus Saccharimonadales bacterium]